jgi:hypothetical protein
MSLADVQRCIQECEKCHDVCLQAVVHCLRRGGRHADPNHITTLLDCVDMCATSVNFMVRESARVARTCGLCAEVCDACAKSCASFHDDDEMRRCAAECQRCAELCRQMGSVTAHA